MTNPAPKPASQRENACDRFFTQSERTLIKVLQTRLGIEPDEAQETATTVITAIKALFAGQTIYITKTDKHSLQTKYSQIRAEREQGKKLYQIASKHRLTTQRIHQIAKPLKVTE